MEGISDFQDQPLASHLSLLDIADGSFPGIQAANSFIRRAGGDSMMWSCKHPRIQHCGAVRAQWSNTHTGKTPAGVSPGEAY